MVAKTPKAAQVKFWYEQHGAVLVAYACCRGLDFASAQDVVQQVFLKLLQHQIVIPDTPVAYLYRAVRNASFNMSRNFRREVELPEPEKETWLVSGDGHPEEALAVQAALQELPEEQREIVFLRIWTGMTLQEAADTTDIPLNTAASRYRYALEKLRVRLQSVAR